MKYRILIEKIETKQAKKVEWEKLHNKEDFDNKEEPQYGYVSTEKTEDIETKIYEQTRDTEFSLKKVIDAFNE